MTKEAHVEIDKTKLAVRMRVTARLDSRALLEGETGLITGFTLSTGQQVRQTSMPRLSTDNEHWSMYFELEAFQDANAVADKLKADLMGLGYTLTKERFPV